MQHQHNKESSRFAWLTPLNPGSSTMRPWVLASNQTDKLVKPDEPHSRKISMDSLLLLAASVLNRSEPCSNTTLAEYQWHSLCGRFSVGWQRMSGDSSRLFVQQASDCFARMEMRMDDRLLAAFNEPVWPHLQRTQAFNPDCLFIPGDFLDALERGGASTCHADNQRH